MTCRIIEEWNFVDFFRTLLGRTAMGRLMWATAILIVPHAIIFAILCCAIGEIWAIFVGIPFFYFGIRSKWRLPKPSKSGASQW